MTLQIYKNLIQQNNPNFSNVSVLDSCKITFPTLKRENYHNYY